MGVDDQLLNQPTNGAAQRAGSLREGKRNNSADSGEPGADEPADNLAEVKATAKKEAAEKEGAAAKIVSVATAPIRQGTSKLLQQAWLHLPDSWGLTLLWIDIHVWLGATFGHDFFCKLGQEWVNTNITTAEQEYAKSQGKIIGTVEPTLLAGCNLGCLLILLTVAFLIALIAGVIDNPFRAVVEIIKYWFWPGK